MDEIKLAEPTAEYADDLWEFRQEIIEADADSDDLSEIPAVIRDAESCGK